MTQAEFIAAVAKETELNKHTAELVLHSITKQISDICGKPGGRLNLPSFGVFRYKHSAARKGRNPATGDAIDIPASSSIGFKASKSLKSVG